MNKPSSCSKAHGPPYWH